MSSPLIKSPLEMLYEQAGIPHMQAGGQPPALGSISPFITGLKEKKPPADLPSDVQMPKYHGAPEFYYFQDHQPVEYYRRGTVPKNTTKEGLETIASNRDANKIKNWVSVMRAGEKYGVPQFSIPQLAASLFKEGREDFGFNEFDYRNPKSLEIYRNLVKEGYDPIAAGFGPAIYDAHQKAKIKGGDPYNHWFGSGVSVDKQTSPEYLAGMKANLQYVNHPKNAPLVNLLQDAYNNPVPPPPTPISTLDAPQDTNNYMPNVDTMGNPTGFSTGGSTTPFYDMSRLLIQKHLSGN